MMELKTRGGSRGCRFTLAEMSYPERSEASLATDESLQPALVALKSFGLKLPQVVPCGRDINPVCSPRRGLIVHISGTHLPPCALDYILMRPGEREGQGIIEYPHQHILIVDGITWSCSSTSGTIKWVG